MRRRPERVATLARDIGRRSRIGYRRPGRTAILRRGGGFAKPTVPYGPLPSALNPRLVSTDAAGRVSRRYPSIWGISDCPGHEKPAIGCDVVVRRLAESAAQSVRTFRDGEEWLSRDDTDRGCALDRLADEARPGFDGIGRPAPDPGQQTLHHDEAGRFAREQTLDRTHEDGPGETAGVTHRSGGRKEAAGVQIHLSTWEFRERVGNPARSLNDVPLRRAAGAALRTH